MNASFTTHGVPVARTRLSAPHRRTTAGSPHRRAHARSPGGLALAQRERGAAALAVTMLLFFAMLLGVGIVNRNLVFEQRASANQYRSTQAFEAAEAGLEWALAQLNADQRLDADCRPTSDAAATSFRARYLSRSAPGGEFVPTTWIDSGIATPLRPTCVKSSAGWSCSCPDNDEPNLAAPTGDAPAPAFALRFQGVGQAGMIRVVAVGCTSLGGACGAAGGASTDASATVQVLFGLLPALRTAPAAALTVRGSVDSDAAFGAHNRNAASGGLAIHAGRAVDASHALLTVPAGASPAAAIVRDDAALANLTPAGFFATYFGIDREGRANQPVVRRVACSGDCTTALLEAAALDGGPSLLQVDGDARIVGPATLGSAQRPVLLVARGALQVEGIVVVHGVLYGGSVAWSGAAGPGALLRGALISEGDYRGDGGPTIVYDADVLARLQRDAGNFARVNGSWRDF